MQRVIERSLLPALLTILSICGAWTIFSPGLFTVPLLLLVMFLGLSILWQNYWISFWALIALSPFNDYIYLNLRVIKLRSYVLFSAFLFLYLAYAIIVDRKEKWCKAALELVHSFAPLIVLFFSKIMSFVLLDSLPRGARKSFFIKYIIIYATLVSAAYFVGSYFTTYERLKKAFQIVLYTGVIVSLVAWFQVIISNTTSIDLVHHRDIISFGRPYAFFREPDVLGAYLSSVLIIAVMFILDKSQDVIPRKHLMLMIGFFSATIVLLLVRAAWVALFVCGLFYVIQLIYDGKRNSIKKITSAISYSVFFISTLLICIFPEIGKKILDRFFSLSTPAKESASSYRLLEIEAMIKKLIPTDWSIGEFRTLLFGNGDFSWTFWAPSLLGKHYDQDALANADSSTGFLTHPGFCMTLSNLFDNGIVGFSCYLMFFIFFAKKFLNYRGDLFVSSLFYATLAILICFQFSYDPIMPFFWILIGLFFGAIEKKNCTP